MKVNATFSGWKNKEENKRDAAGARMLKGESTGLTGGEKRGQVRQWIFRGQWSAGSHSERGTLLLSIHIETRCGFILITGCVGTQQDPSEKYSIISIEKTYGLTLIFSLLECVFGPFWWINLRTGMLRKKTAFVLNYWKKILNIVRLLWTIPQ